MRWASGCTALETGMGTACLGLEHAESTLSERAAFIGVPDQDGGALLQDNGR